MVPRNDAVRNRVRLLALAAVLLLAVTGSAVAHSGDDGGHHHDGWMGMHDDAGGVFGTGIGWGWMLLWMIVLVGVPAALIYALVVRAGDGQDESDALDVLRRRYAEGEIDDEEYDRRRERLT
ncbi:SHOCT domain-containing protein [Haloarculaceae archaeon H-GB2-1]|nr:SHOCT domain-containing protein [Haloarculaceae archaeon H-GB1-1]MEA5386677.1 SHOCT domain-containing protein [Haloarculaceae archaeon H-GB11]MEA5408201.1 SHOCT domain-containing protein [Haloarculaceae archaeon H-GB2-1]